MPPSRKAGSRRRDEVRGNSRMRGENRERDTRLDTHDETLGSHGETLGNQNDKLAGHDTDISRIRKGETLQDNSIGGAPIASFSHTTTADGGVKDPESDLNFNQNSARAIGADQVKARGLRSHHFPDGEIASRKLGDISPGRVRVAKKGGGDQSMDSAYLRSDTNANFSGGHGNDHHDPKFSVVGHTHSISFKDLPEGERQAILDIRQTLRFYRTRPLTQILASQKAVTALIDGILAAFHMAADSPSMTAEQVHTWLKDHPEGRAELTRLQGEEQNPDAYYYSNPSPENGGGVPPSPNPPAAA